MREKCRSTLLAKGKKKNGEQQLCDILKTPKERKHPTQLNLDFWNIHSINKVNGVSPG